jgi:hypothetical protein
MILFIPVSGINRLPLPVAGNMWVCFMRAESPSCSETVRIEVDIPKSQQFRLGIPSRTYPVG